MSVRAKFIVHSITRTQGGTYKESKWIPQEVQTIRLIPVAGSSEENKAFFASTPSGSIDLGTINIEAARQFDLNKEYYVDFTPATA